MIENYLKHEAYRAEKGIPALPLDANQTTALCELLQNPPSGKEEFLLHLFKERIAPGVDPAAQVKAIFLNEILKGTKKSPLINKAEAVKILGTMIGGYNVTPLIEALKNEEIAKEAVQALKHTILVYDSFNTVAELSKTNVYAMQVLKSWAEAEWFTQRNGLPETITLKAYKVDGEINTDDFSPASDASTRPDIPLHALSMGNTRFPEGNATIAKWRKEGSKVAFVGDVVGTGSSRKSATNSVLWHIGENIPAVPNKRREGFVIGGVIAPIFFNTVEDSGGMPIICDVSKINSGDLITINTKEGTITNPNNQIISTFKLVPSSISDEYKAGGRMNLIIGKALTKKARKALNMGETTIFTIVEQPKQKENQGFTLAQKMVGKAIGEKGVLPGQAVEPFMTTVGSQDTTGPMTADELTELSCLKFQTPMFMQSFCHTAAYPKPTDVKMHKYLPKFISDREGVALNPGDGVIHTWLNRLLIPDTVGTGGDSHTRFPLGISFPAGSGLIAFAGALGFMPLDMPESVLVKFKGKLNKGITLRDVVNSIPLQAIKEGKLTVPKKNKINVFNGRILEMEGLPDITVEQAFELTDAAAERSAAAATIKLSENSVVAYLKSNIALMESMIKEGYSYAPTIQKRIDAIKEWLKNPKLMERDQNAEYAVVIEIDLSEIKEPILCCPNDPDDVKVLSEVAGTKINDVFLGSCMTNIGHFRAAGKIWEGNKVNKETRTFIAPPTRMDQSKLKEEGLFSVFNQIGARIEVPGCSLCMGNQLRVADGDFVYSTSTRNFDNRMGNKAQVFLGSAELGAVVSLMSKLPTPAEYFEYYNKNIEGNENEIYRYLQFDEENEEALYKRRDI
jgi:aconitate hydratase 2/2-methylisocitrate dehydratase